MLCFSGLLAAAPPGTHRKHLDQPTVIQGYPCAKGYAWFFPDSHLNRCSMARDFDLGEARLPSGSVIELFPDGSLRYVMLQHNTTLNGVPCAGGGPLGPAEGSVTILYPSGKLKSCYLVEDQTVQGVPCARGGLWMAVAGHEHPVEFYDTGKLRSCGLARDFTGQRRGERFLQSP